MKDELLQKTLKIAREIHRMMKEINKLEKFTGYECMIKDIYQSFEDTLELLKILLGKVISDRIVAKWDKNYS